MQSQGQIPQAKEGDRQRGDSAPVSLDAFKNLLSRLAELKSQQERVGQ